MSAQVKKPNYTTASFTVPASQNQISMDKIYVSSFMAKLGDAPKSHYAHKLKNSFQKIAFWPIIETFILL